MSDPNRLVDFWSAFAPARGDLNLHPRDRDWMREFWPDPLEQKFYSSWNEYISGSQFGSRDAAVHLSLLPVPYMGNVEQAKILIFLANAGFDDGNYFVDFEQEFRHALIANLRQEVGIEFPFVYLNPVFAWSGAFQWWEAKLRPIIDLLMARGRNYTDALRYIAQNIAAVELFPYHSRDGSKLKGTVGTNLIPSVAAAKSFLASATANAQQLKLVMRKHKSWHSVECSPESEHYVHAPRIQSVSFHPRFGPGKKIAEYLDIT